MAVKGNTGEVEVTKQFKTIIGIAPFKVVAINPTMEQLVSLGINTQKEPEYLGKKSRIDFWMQTQLPATSDGGADKSLAELGIEKQLLEKQTIFISDEQKGKSDGSTVVWINKFGNICSTATGDKPSASWWKPDGEHIAREGEIEVLHFIRSWINSGPTDEVSIDDWSALIRGNVKELRDILKDYKENIVRSMIEVRISKEGKTYHGIYTGHHEPWNITSLTNWTKEFKVLKQGQHVSYQLQEFKHSNPIPTEDAAPAADATEKTAWT